MRIGWYIGAAGVDTASIRLRALTPIAELSAMGYEAALWTRGAPTFDVVVFSKVYDDRAFETAKAMREQGARIVLDLCDNHWFGEETNAVVAARAGRLGRMVAIVDRLTTSTPTLASQIAARFDVPGERIDVIPDPVMETGPVQPGLRGRIELSLLRRWIRRHADAEHLLWFGNHGAGHVRSGMEDLERIRSTIECSDARFTLTIASNSRKKFKRLFADWSIPVRYIPWRLDTIDAVMAAHDAAVIPITLSDFTIAKTMNRPATALMAGLDVFADRIPSYGELAPFIALDSWEGLAGLPKMRADRVRRTKNASDWLKSRYAPSAIAEGWANVALQALR